MTDDQLRTQLQATGMSAPEIEKRVIATKSVRYGNTTILIPMGYPFYWPMQGPPYLYNEPKPK